MTKSIQDMTADEKFSALVELEWDLDSGKLHQQFPSFENYRAFRQTERLTHVRLLRQRGMTEDEKQRYLREWQASQAIQEEFTDVENFLAYRCAEERQLIGR